jgi:hypothetical protein
MRYLSPSHLFKKWSGNAMRINTLLICLSLLFAFSAEANGLQFNIKAGLPYDEAKASLIADGWTPLVNSKITHSSLYAQEIFEKGLTEVVDCISMELDACSFRYIKNNKTLEVKTITRALKVDKVNLINKK